MSQGAEPEPRRPGAAFQSFVDLISRLRAPGGCPWDREQTHRSLKPMTLEEAYEVLEAIDEGDDEALAGELGDLLLQVVFHAQIAAEGGRFGMADVIEGIAAKMVRRHPHVFGDKKADTAGEVLRNWEALKEAEQEGKGRGAGMMDGVSRSLPAAMEAFQMTTKASRVGFDWPHAGAALEKLDEEAAELKEAMAKTHEPGESGGALAPADDGGFRGVASAPPSHRAKCPPEMNIAEEVGDLLFVAVNVARLLGVDPESALKAANRKFRRRFAHVEERLRGQGKKPADATLEEMEALWVEAKGGEKRGGQ